MRSLAGERSTVDAQPLEFARRLYLSHAEDLHRYASRRVGREVADDVVAETFRRVLEHRDRFDESRGSQRAWLFGIATNILRNHHRTEKRRLAALARTTRRTPVGIDPLIDTPAHIDAQRDLRVVLDAAATLDRADYELLVLVVWEELSSTDAAAALGLQPGTVRSRLHRIRQQLSAACDAATERHRTWKGADNGHPH